MKPKAIIVKTNTDFLEKKLVKELSHYPSIRFFSKKINGEGTIVIKCYPYYDPHKTENPKNFYGNYTFLTTCLSLILTDLIIENYETVFIHRILQYNYFYYGKEKQKKLSQVIRLILDPFSPLENNQELLFYRKQLVLAALLKNFHHTNFLPLDGYINFRLSHYYAFLEELVFHIVQFSLVHAISIEKINSILKNMFDY